MENVKFKPIASVLPSCTDVAFLLPLVFLFVVMDGFKTMLGDGDTGWHIRTGEWILASHQVPSADIFSFTKAGEPWFAWEWLWDVCFAVLHQHWGLTAVVLVNVLLLCIISTLLFQLANSRCGSPIVALAVTIVATAGSAIHWLARPHLITLLFTVVFIWMLEKARDGRTGLLKWLPLLMLLWVNLHGGFVVGIICALVYAAADFTDALLQPDRTSRIRLAVRACRFAATGFACALASLINPYTYHLHQHIWSYLASPYHRQNISEFQSVNFQRGGVGFFECMLIFGVLSAAYGLRKRRLADAFLILIWAHLALTSVRNIPIFMIVAAAPAGLAAVEFAKGLWESRSIRGWLRTVIEELKSVEAEFRALDTLPRLHAVSIAGAAFICLLVSLHLPSLKLKPEYDANVYPAKALEALNASLAGTRLFADDEWGDYLIYRLYPKTKVFVDGRSDFYGEQFGEEYQKIVRVEYNWESILNKYSIDTVLLSPKTPLASTLKESRRWSAVYDDGTAIVFRAAGSVGEQKISAANAAEMHGTRGTIIRSHPGLYLIN